MIKARGQITITDIQDGTTITSVSVTYATTTDNTQPSEFPYTSVPMVRRGTYLWSKTTVEYSDGKHTDTIACSRIGSDGDKGDSLHIAYSTEYPVTKESFSKVYKDGVKYVGIYSDADKDNLITAPSVLLADNGQLLFFSDNSDGEWNDPHYQWQKFVGSDGAPAETYYINPSAVIVTEQLNLSGKDTEEQRNNKYTNKDFSYIIPSPLAIHHSVGSEDIIIKVPDGGWSCSEGAALLPDDWATTLQNSFKTGTGYDLTSILTKDKLSSNSSVIKISLVATITSAKLNIAVYINRLGTIQSTTYGDTTETVRKKIVNEVVGDSITKAQNTADAAQKKADTASNAANYAQNVANAAVKSTDFEAYTKSTAEKFSQIYTKSETDSQISSKVEQTADEIKLGISSRKEYRNIIKGSDFSYIADNVLLNAGNGQTVEVSDTERYDTSRSVHIKVTKEGDYNGVFVRPVIVKTSTKHYLSVLAKGTGTLAIEAISIDSDGTRKERIPTPDITLSSEWTLYRVPFTTGGYDRIEVNFWMYKVGEAYIARPMLEEGSEYTGWTLSPDDPTTEDRLRDTGIDIRKGTIDLRAGNVNFLGADGKPYITAELDDDGMPHLIFYNKAGTAMYDLGYTGLFNLIQDSDKQTWVEYSGQVIDGDTANCSALTGGNYRLSDGDIAESLILYCTIYEYHPAYVMSNGEKTYYNNDCKNQLYYTDTVDESSNNKPTGKALYTDDGILRLNGYLYELVERKVVSKKTNGGTTTIEEHFRFRAHAIYRNRLNLSGGMTDYTEGRTVKIEKYGTAIAGSVETKYKVSIDGSDYEDKDIVKL